LNLNYTTEVVATLTSWCCMHDLEVVNIIQL
jgi:hypothetical protein